MMIIVSGTKTVLSAFQPPIPGLIRYRGPEAHVFTGATFWTASSTSMNLRLERYRTALADLP
jgi:hypothetical protein